MYISLLNNPHSPRPYRQLRDHYEKLGMTIEANAFTAFLMDNFGDLPPLKDADDPPANPES